MGVAGSDELPLVRARPQAGARRRRGLTPAASLRAALATAGTVALALVAAGCSAGGGASATGATSTTTTGSAAGGTEASSAAPSAAPTTAPTAAPTAAPSGSSTTAPLTKADQWVLRAISAEQQAGSVHIDGTIDQGKRRIYLKLLVNSNGEGGGVFVQGRSLIRVERVGTLLYFNAPKAYWTAHASAAQAKAYGGKWIELSALDSRYTSFDQFLNAADLTTAAFQGHTSPLTLRRGTYRGHKVVIVKDTEHAQGKQSSGVMYIAAKGSPHVYKIVSDTPGNVSTLVFSHYGKAVSLTVPPEAINLSGS